MIILCGSKCNSFFQAVMYVLIPLGIISSALSSSFQEGIMKRWKVFLVVLAVTIVYVIAHFLMQYMQDNNFFQCNVGWQIWGRWGRSMGPYSYNMTFLSRLEFDNIIQNEHPDEFRPLYTHALWATLGT